MTRIEGVDPRRLTDEYAAKVLEAQAKAWGRVAALNGCEF